MTEPRGKQPARQAEAVDQGLEVRPEVIQDLDVNADDVGGDVRGGCLRTELDPCGNSVTRA